ncbi:MAG: hypothetical protein FD150_616 [Rhodobacteraceae bacterium]|nr:MAG: hypothetical protein FD150_616 [Paracoccaceae bacterium]
MLTSITRAWRVYREERERTALANRLGPHIARDVGLDAAMSHRVLPALRSH